MSWFERIKSFFQREARDVKEGLGKAGQAIDEELAKKERELAATPEERIDMILEEQKADDARFQQLTDKVKGQVADAEAGEEIAGTTELEEKLESDPGAPTE